MSMLMHGEFEEAKTKRVLEMLLNDRGNEFRELAELIIQGSAKESIKNWELFILNFCLDVSLAFKTWTDQKETEQNSGLKALTILRQVGRHKTSMLQLTQYLNVAYDLAEEFKLIYKRIG